MRGMDHKKTARTCILFISICILTVVLDWVKWDVSRQMLMAGLFNLIVMIFILLIFIGLLIWGIIYAIKKYSQNKFIAFLPLLILIITVMIHTVLPRTTTYQKLNFEFNKSDLIKIVQMFESGEMQNYQIGENEYILPNHMRRISHTGSILAQTREEAEKYLFYIHCGIGKSFAYIYVSGEGEIKDGDFGCTYEKIQIVEDGWYVVTINN